MGEEASSDNDLTSSYVASLNRCAVCCLAVCLLWLTSLQMSIAIVERNVKTTTLNSVLISCKYAFNEVGRESERYAQCVQEQFAVCNTALTTAFLEEKSHSDEAQMHNTRCVLESERMQSNCSTTVTMATNSLKLWSTLDINRAIPYQNCSRGDRLLVSSSLGDASSSARTNAMTTSSEYIKSSDATASHLGSYIHDINEYNAGYVKNKTKLLATLSVDGISAPFLGAIEARFVALENKVSALLSCLSLSGTTCVGTVAPCPYPTNLLEQYDSLRMYVNANVNAAMRLFNEADVGIVTVGVSITAAVAKANAFYASVVKAKNALANLGIDVCGGSFPHPEMCSFKTSDWFIPLPPRPSLPVFARLPDGSALWDQVKGVPVQVKAEVANASSATNQDVRALMMAADVALRKMTVNVLGDYRPPAYPYTTNATADIKTLRRKSKAFLTEMSSTLAAVGAVPLSATLPPPTNAQNASRAAAGLGASLLSSFRTEWASLSPFAGFSLVGWLASLATLRGALFLFDYLFRAVHTVRLVYRFIKPSTTELPPVQLGPSKARGLGSGSRLCQSIARGCSQWQAALQLLPFIYIQLLAFVAFFAFCVWVVAAVYVPAYDRYVEGCVTHVANDSLFSAAAGSLSYNFAATNGNAALSSGMQEYNGRVVDCCSAQQLPSQRAYDQALQAMATINCSRQADWAQVQLLSGCVNFATMDALFGYACCDPSDGTYGSQKYTSVWPGTADSGAVSQLAKLCASVPSAAAAAAGTTKPRCPVDSVSGLPYPPPGMTLHQSTCGPSRSPLRALSLVDSRFSCRALPTCQVTCRGPDAALVHAVSKSCTCMSEWLVHGNVFGALVAVCVYLFLNASRVLIMKGVTLLCWRSLCPQTENEFVVHLLANDKGEITSAEGATGPSEDETDQPHRMKDDFDISPDSNITELGGLPNLSADRSERGQIARAVEAMLRGVLWKGRLFIVVGITCNAVWIAILLLARKNIAYSP